MLQGSVARAQTQGHLWGCVWALPVPGHVGVQVHQCSRKAAVRAPSQPLMVPLDRTCGPSCHQGLVPSTLAGVDRWTP